MAINIITTVGTVAATTPAPATFQDLLISVAQNVELSLDITGNESQIFIGPVFPPVASTPHGSIFALTGPLGQPLSLWVLGTGTQNSIILIPPSITIWQKVHSYAIGRLSWFIGNPNNYFTANGLGIGGLDWDGWALANSNNNTSTYMRNRLLDGIPSFMVPGYRIDGGGAVANFVSTSLTAGMAINSPVAAVGDEYSGTASSFVISASNLPILNVILPLNESFVFQPGPIALIPAGNTPSSIPGALSYFNQFIQGDPNLNESIQVLPPYIAAGLAEFIGSSSVLIEH